MVKDNYLVWHSYKILTRILGCNYMLHKMKISITPICRICKNEDETLLHLFCRCPSVDQLWSCISNWIFDVIHIRVVFQELIIILGYQNKDNRSIPINTLIMASKSYIFWAARNGKTKYFNSDKNRIIKTFKEQELIAKKNFSLEKFDKSWNA